MEPGETSQTQPWAKLVPTDSAHSHIEIRSNEMIICSETSISLRCKITRNSDLCSATLQNLSSTTILVDGTCVEKEETMVVKCGADIISGLRKEGYIAYRFRLMAVPENSQKLTKIPLDSEHAKCSICLHIWHDVVTVAPCLHNFCNGCFSELLKRSQKKHSNVPCPQCRADVYSVGRNHFLRNIEQGILESDLSLRRPSEELAVLDGNASIQSNLVISSRNLHSRKRPHSPVNEEDQVDSPCPQCGSGFGGFHCSQSTSHIQCQACGGRMPVRTDISVPQQCLGCDGAFCWSYWRAQGVLTSDTYTICRHENFKPISEYITGSRMPLLTHESNRIEQDITERCIRQTGKTLENLISDWIQKLNNKEIDVSRMPLKHADAITSGTYVCSNCYEKLVSFLLYWYRVTIPKHHLPADVAGREDCWYGYACRTQHRNQDHARKRNHVCRPTRGSGM
ncbi:RING-type E3 ubiquitin transferase [Ranunculus cassubicifolius]